MPEKEPLVFQSDEFPTHPVIERIKVLGRTNLTVALFVVGLTIMILGLFGNFLPKLSNYDSQQRILEFLQTLPLDENELNQLYESESFRTFMGNIQLGGGGGFPFGAVLLTLSIGLFLRQARQKKPFLSTGWLLPLKVLTIFELVTFCLAGLLGLLLIGLLALSPNPTALVVMLPVTAAVALLIIAAAQGLGILSRITKTIQTGQPDSKVSRLVEVIFYLSAGFSLISAVVLCTHQGYLLIGTHASQTLAVISLLLEAGFSVLTGLWLRKYRGIMRELEIVPPQAPSSM